MEDDDFSQANRHDRLVETYLLKLQDDVGIKFDAPHVRQDDQEEHAID